LQQNFGGIVLGWPPSKLCLVIPTSNQDGRQARNRKKGDEILKKSSPLKLLSQSQPNFAEMILGWSPSAVQPFWSEGRTTRHKFGRGPSNDYFIKVWFQLSNWFQTRRFLCEFPIGSYIRTKY
jgi:hypothetical protein